MGTRCELSSLRNGRRGIAKSHNTVHFYATRRRRVTVEFDDDHCKLGVSEPPPYPTSRHRISHPNPPVLRGGNSGDLETSISAYLTSEGVTPAEGQDIVAGILSFLDRLVGNPDKGFRVYANLVFITNEVVWIGRLPNFDMKTVRKLYAEKVLPFDQGTCAICLEDNTAHDCNQRSLKSLPCKHQFHRLCIVRWLYTSLTCPICRREIDEDYRRVFAEG